MEIGCLCTSVCSVLMLEQLVKCQELCECSVRKTTAVSSYLCRKFQTNYCVLLLLGLCGLWSADESDSGCQVLAAVTVCDSPPSPLCSLDPNWSRALGGVQCVCAALQMKSDTVRSIFNSLCLFVHLLQRSCVPKTHPSNTMLMHLLSSPFEIIYFFFLYAAMLKKFTLFLFQGWDKRGEVAGKCC